MAKRKLEQMSGDASMAYARLADDIAREILLVARRENISKAELAARIGRDKGFITRVLSGAHNLQLRTIAAMLGAMGNVLEIKARPVRRAAAERANSPPPPQLIVTDNGRPTKIIIPPKNDITIKQIAA